MELSDSEKIAQLRRLREQKEQATQHADEQESVHTPTTLKKNHP